MANGRFIPRNPGKYAGNPDNILWRSSWEFRVMKFFDSSIAVIKWGSEELRIPYIKPTDGRVHNYFPDFVVVYRDKAGEVKKEIVEIKPLKESVPLKAKTDRDKVAMAINLAKWDAASRFAQRNGMMFRVLTEQTIFKQPKREARVKTASKVARAPRSARKAGE